MVVVSMGWVGRDEEQYELTNGSVSAGCRAAQQQQATTEATGFIVVLLADNTGTGSRNWEIERCKEECHPAALSLCRPVALPDTQLLKEKKNKKK